MHYPAADPTTTAGLASPMHRAPAAAARPARPQRGQAGIPPDHLKMRPMNGGMPS